jgi:hypothetical protein
LQAAIAEQEAAEKVKQYIARTKAKESHARQLPKLLDYFLSPDLTFVTESRPGKRPIKSTASRIDGPKDAINVEEHEAPPMIREGRPPPEDAWTSLRRIEVNERMLRSVKQNLDLKKDAQPDIFQVKAAVPALFIGMEAGGKRPVITDKNPHVEGLQDIHRCVYLPSAAEKAYQLSATWAMTSQLVLFIELPPGPLCAPGVGTRAS